MDFNISNSILFSRVQSGVGGIIIPKSIVGALMLFISGASHSASIDILYNGSSKVYYVANINITAGELRNTRPMVQGVYFSFTSPAGSVECRQGDNFTGCKGASWGTLPVYCPTATEAIHRFRTMLTGAILTDEPSANTSVEIACMSGPNSAWRFAGPVSPPPVIPASCKIHGPITLDHGSISIADINGDISTSEVKIECSKESDVSLKIENNGVITLGNNSIKSNVYLNGVSGGSVKINKVGPNGQYVKVSSTLASLGGVNSGNFNGSSVITLEIL